VQALVASTQVSPLYKTAGVALLDRALALYHVALTAEGAAERPDAASVLHGLERLSLRDLRIAEWSEAEVQKFNEGLEELSDDLEELARTLPRKTRADVVHFYYVTRPDMCARCTRRQVSCC
jgi:hypothetical protein